MLRNLFFLALGSQISYLSISATLTNQTSQIKYINIDIQVSRQYKYQFKIFIYFILAFICMSLAQKKSDIPLFISSSNRKVDVILLADHRNSFNNHISNKFRSSAFKCFSFIDLETEVDPIEEKINNLQPAQQGSLSALLQRLGRLERRVQQLEDLREDIPTELETKEKKRRRRFQQMQRSIEVQIEYIECNKCKKSYGSETALKYHCKLKHSSNQIQPYSSE